MPNEDERIVFTWIKRDSNPSTSNKVEKVESTHSWSSEDENLTILLILLNPNLHTGLMFRSLSILEGRKHVDLKISVPTPRSFSPQPSVGVFIAREIDPP